MLTLGLPDAEATCRLAALIADHLDPGDVILLDGPLGAGKTTWVRGLVVAMAGDPAAVSSPTYTLLHQYQARIPVIHVDAYRLNGPGGLDGLGFDELRDAGVAVVEWASRVAAAFSQVDCWRIALSHCADGSRQALIQPNARCADAWLRSAPRSWMVTTTDTRIDSVNLPL